MVTIVRNGVSLSASATLNGFPLRFADARPTRMGGDFAETDMGRARRQDRRNKQAQRAFLSGL